LSFVLDKVAAAQVLLEVYRRDYEVIWWCGHFQQAFDGGPLLSASLLERLAAFGAAPVHRQLLQPRRVVGSLNPPT
jgi:hypothetical protein